MRELTNDVPKPMIEVRGKPVLQHIVQGLRDAGVGRLLIIVGYHAEAVQEFFRGWLASQCRHRIRDTNRAGWHGPRCESCPRFRRRFAIHFELWRYLDQSGELQTRGRSSE